MKAEIAEMEERIDEYIKANRCRLINSILVYKNGKLVFERYFNKYTEKSRNNIKSVWKSILSVCVGICLDKGYIKNLDEPIGNYLTEFNKNVHAWHRMITIRSLLTMTSGIYWTGGVHYHCPMLAGLFRSSDWLGYLSDVAMADIPGTKHVYKEWDVILLSAIIGKACGMTSYDFCAEYLYEPLGIASGRWSESPCGVSCNITPPRESDSDLSACDMAKIGLLFMNGGVFGGERIISGEYIDMAVSPSPQDEKYGFLWWIFDWGYACRGYGGQEVNVLPERKLTVVVQATPSPRSMSYNEIFEGIIKTADL